MFESTQMSKYAVETFQRKCTSHSTIACILFQFTELHLEELVKYVIFVFLTVIMKFMGDAPLSKHQKDTDIVFSLLKVCHLLDKLSRKDYVL